MHVNVLTVAHTLQAGSQPQAQIENQKKDFLSSPHIKKMCLVLVNKCGTAIWCDIVIPGP